MRTTSIPALFAAIMIMAGLTACEKDTQELAQDTGVLPSTCGSNGARVQATIDGASYCGSAQVNATGDEGTVIVTGVDLTGNTLVVQADSLVVGVQEITDANNGVLYMPGSTPFVVMPGDSGTLTITEVDTAARVLKANFSVTVHNEMSGSSHAVQGSLDVVYTDGE